MAVTSPFPTLLGHHLRHGQEDSHSSLRKPLPSLKVAGQALNEAGQKTSRIGGSLSGPNFEIGTTCSKRSPNRAFSRPMDCSRLTRMDARRVAPLLGGRAVTYAEFLLYLDILDNPVSVAHWESLPLADEPAAEVSSELCSAPTSNLEPIPERRVRPTLAKPIWQGNFSGQAIQRSSSAPSLSNGVPHRGRSSMRHRASILDARSLSRSALESQLVQAQAPRNVVESQKPQGKAPRNVALIRMIIAEAKKRHCERQSFQKRAAEQGLDATQGIHSKEPTLWRLSQSSEIFREVVHDILAAVRACSAVSTGLQSLQKSIDKRKCHEAVCKKWQRGMSQLSNVQVFSKQLSDARSTETHWDNLSFVAADQLTVHMAKKRHSKRGSSHHHHSRHHKVAP